MLVEPSSVSSPIGIPASMDNPYELVQYSTQPTGTHYVYPTTDYPSRYHPPILAPSSGTTSGTSSGSSGSTSGGSSGNTSSSGSESSFDTLAKLYAATFGANGGNAAFQAPMLASPVGPDFGVSGPGGGGSPVARLARVALVGALAFLVWHWWKNHKRSAAS